MLNVALAAVVWLVLGVLVGLAFGAAESLGGKRAVLGVLKWRWQPVAFLLAALLLGGCASAGQVKGDVWTVLSPAEKAESQAIEAATAKLAEACLRTRTDCRSPGIYVHRNGMWPTYSRQGHLINLPRFVLQPAWRGVVAHELAHAWFSDARDDCQGPEKTARCERNANAHAVGILEIGFGYDRATALRMVQAMLQCVAGVHQWDQECVQALTAEASR